MSEIDAKAANTTTYFGAYGDPISALASGTTTSMPIQQQLGIGIETCHLQFSSRFSVFDTVAKLYSKEHRATYKIEPT